MIPLDTIIIRRSAAMGDLIQAFPISVALAEMGIRSCFITSPQFHCVAQRFGIILFPPTELTDIDLDYAYERQLDSMRFVSIRQMFVEKANADLSSYGIHIDPHSVKPPKARKQYHPTKQLFLSKYPQPWVFICPHSATPRGNGLFYFNKVRSVPVDTWQEAAKHIHGTCFWMGTAYPAPEGIQPLRIGSILDVLEWLDCADAFLTVDTGPMHFAGSLGIPIVAIHQAFNPEMTFEDCPNRMIVKASVDCIGCVRHLCPINADNPPCQKVDPMQIAVAANEQLAKIEIPNSHDTNRLQVRTG